MQAPKGASPEQVATQTDGKPLSSKGVLEKLTDDEADLAIFQLSCCRLGLHLLACVLATIAWVVIVNSETEVVLWRDDSRKGRALGADSRPYCYLVPRGPLRIRVDALVFDGLYRQYRSPVSISVGGDAAYCGVTVAEVDTVLAVQDRLLAHLKPKGIYSLSPSETGLALHNTIRYASDCVQPKEMQSSVVDCCNYSYHQYAQVIL